jgi:hypothetical protein
MGRSRPAKVKKNFQQVLRAEIGFVPVEKARVTGTVGQQVNLAFGTAPRFVQRSEP